VPWQTDTYLRRADRNDLDTLVTWMQEPDFQHFLYGDPNRAPRRLREQIVGVLGRALLHTTPSSIYLILDSPSAGPIGMIALQNISWRNRNCSIDVYIGKKELRGGWVAALGVYRALEYCFDELNLHRVSAYIYAFNRASWRIWERTGAVREMTLKEHILRDGEYHDVYVYGLLKDEFDRLRAAFGERKGLSLQDMIQSLAQE